MKKQTRTVFGKEVAVNPPTAISSLHATTKELQERLTTMRAQRDSLTDAIITTEVALSNLLNPNPKVSFPTTVRN